jgi:hypothetical protein
MPSGPPHPEDNAATPDREQRARQGNAEAGAARHNLLLSSGEQYGCFCSKSAAKDPALVAGPADPQPPDRVPRIAASSGGHAPIALLFLLLFGANYQLPLPLSRPRQPPPSATTEARTYHVIVAILSSIHASGDMRSLHALST